MKTRFPEFVPEKNREIYHKFVYGNLGVRIEIWLNRDIWSMYIVFLIYKIPYLLAQEIDFVPNF